jgi:THAP domain
MNCFFQVYNDKNMLAPGSRTGYSGSSADKRHLFTAPKDAERRQHWNRCIPRDAVLQPHHVLCDLHFDEQFIIKTFDSVVNGEFVRIPREKWTLTIDALVHFVMKHSLFTEK